jgi:cation diffusion facilitator CzcD-associated flavoprotein CzcO
VSGSQRSELRIAIIGAGPGGLCMARRLLGEGYRDFVVLERSAGVGGTWNHNRYPGCECDVQSALYSFSFEVKPDWSKPYGTQPEILAYMEHVAKKYGILPHCRFGAEVTGARWDEPRARWTLTLASGETLEADVVVSALGMFNDLAWPEIPGLDQFRGTVFHSARWNWEHDLAGESVAVIGSAASAVQFVPEIVQRAGQVYLFQRSANWVLPKADQPYSVEQLETFRAEPARMAALREQLHRQLDEFMTFQNPKALADSSAAGLAAIEVVRDPALRAKLRPTHPYGCKRPLISNYYYPAFNRPNLELVSERIERISADSVLTADGKARRVDTLILATGFETTRYLSAIDVRGRGGRRIDDAWRDGAIAYLGITTAGFPNLFMLYGPNTNNGSIITMIESQVEHVMLHLRRLLAEDLAWVDVRPGAMERYNAEVQDAISRIEVWQAACNGYYRSPSGRVVTQWPFSMTEFRKRTAVLEREAFEVARRA